MIGAQGSMDRFDPFVGARSFVVANSYFHTVPPLLQLIRKVVAHPVSGLTKSTQHSRWIAIISTIVRPRPVPPTPSHGKFLSFKGLAWSDGGLSPPKANDYHATSHLRDPPAERIRAGGG